MATGRTVNINAVTIAGTALTKVISLDMDESGTRITSAEDDDVYIQGQHVHSVDVTGSCVTRDTAAARAVNAGDSGTVAAELGDEDGAGGYVVAVLNTVVISVSRTQGYGAWGETTVNWGAKSSDGVVSPLSVAAYA